MKNQLVISCRKCGHLLFISEKNINIKWFGEWVEKCCPRCGEENSENWTIDRLGNYDIEYGCG